MGNSVLNYIVTLMYIYTSTCGLLRPDLRRTCARASPLATTQLELYLEEEVFLVRRTVLEGDLEDGRHPASLLRQLHQRRHRVLACSENTRHRNVQHSTELVVNSARLNNSKLLVENSDVG